MYNVRNQFIQIYIKHTSMLYDGKLYCFAVIENGRSNEQFPGIKI